MESCTWFCVAAAAVYTFTLLRKLGLGFDAGFWPMAIVGASLGFIISPGFCGLVLLSCSLSLVWNTESRRRRELLPTESRAVLITGCDSGFGHALAKLLSEMGVKVFAGVLDVNGAGAQQLRERGSENLQVLQLDVTDGSQIETAHRYICTQVGDAGLWGLVNNAGLLHCPVDAELHPISVYRRCMEVNFLAAVSMCQVFLPLLRRSKGRIVNMCSLAGEVPMPTYAAYGASKAALSIFSKVMRLELSVWGVKVAVIQPTGFRTNIFGNSDDLSHYRDEILSGISPEAREDYGETYISSLLDRLSTMSNQMTEDLSPVVDDMRHALLSVRPRQVYTPGQLGWLLPFLHRWCPTTTFDSIIMSVLKYTGCEPAGLQRN
ncbi:estradiol 17-beta-dehydrogenase 2 [Anabas testudineus]|uniref:Hydroxysteroid (17-beta) dehydrogenase 2 n=1 Tax=Anabas testudineus TaxID=64144 RepID=A0A7N5ZTF3_ANATE|nr:estradiol 17-beta-dehydrogenase 2 [Anabas testudineus]